MALQADVLTVLIIFASGLLTIILTAWMLNRAWGNFPDRAGLPPTPLTPTSAPPEDDEWRAENEEDEEDEARSLPAGASSGNLIEVTHPMVLQAVQRAMEKPGSPYSTYFIRDGERVFLVLTRIADPAQRETARRLFTGINSGNVEGLGMGELMQLFNQLGKR